MTNLTKFLTIAAVFTCSTAAHAIAVDAWGGYNLSTGYSNLDNVVTASDTTYKAAGYTTSGASSKSGGVAFGADLWVDIAGMKNLQVGGGFAYLPLYDLDYSAKLGTSSAAMKANLKTIPVLAEARLSFGDLYVGAGFGYSIGLGKFESTATAGTVANSAVVSFNGAGLTAMGMAGYNFISLGVVKLGVEARVYMVLDSSTSLNFVPAVKAEFGF